MKAEVLRINMPKDSGKKLKQRRFYSQNGEKQFIFDHQIFLSILFQKKNIIFEINQSACSKCAFNLCFPDMVVFMVDMSLEQPLLHKLSQHNELIILKYTRSISDAKLNNFFLKKNSYKNVKIEDKLLLTILAVESSLFELFT